MVHIRHGPKFQAKNTPCIWCISISNKKTRNFISVNAKDIIEQLYRSDDLENCLSRIQPADIRDDVKQHVFTELLLKPEADIMDLWERGKFTAYVAKMLVNMVRWERSSFRKLQGRETALESFSDIADEQPIEIIVVPLEKLYWYDAKMLELYAEHGSYRKVEAVTGIEFSGICKTIKKARIEIKKHMDL